jgi:hypothetical protein
MSLPDPDDNSKIPFRAFPVDSNPFNGSALHPFMDPKSLVEAYAARLQSESDYAR